MHFKNLLKLSCFILLCLFVMPAIAQNISVTGKVTDAKDGSAITGVSILLKGTSTGPVTDKNGNFKISAPATGTLVVTYICYDRKEVRVSASPMKNSLNPNATQLSEVTVVSIGYGTAKKKDLTGAVENISAKNFNQGAIINPIDQLTRIVASHVFFLLGC